VYFLFYLATIEGYTQNPKPFVVSELRVWKGADGSFLISGKTKMWRRHIYRILFR